MKINTSAVRRLCLLTLTVLCVTVSRASTYIVAVGINNYKYVTSLTVSEDDARAFAQMCKSYPDLHVALVTGSKATRANLIDVIGSHFAKAKADDSLIFFFSGHGVGGGVVAYDTEDDSENSILSYKVLARLMKRSPATRKVIIIDSCHSGRRATPPPRRARCATISETPIPYSLCHRAPTSTLWKCRACPNRCSPITCCAECAAMPMPTATGISQRASSFDMSAEPCAAIRGTSNTP